MFICYFKNLLTGEIFSKEFDSPYKMNQFMIKCRYSKKIQSLGSTKKWA